MSEVAGLSVAKYNDVSPVIGGPPAFIGDGATILGRATLGADAWLGEYSVIRADGHFIQIGDDFHIGAHATVHIAHDLFPATIGDRVTVGKRAVVHACNIGDDCIVESGAVVLDGSKIGPKAIISAKSVVFPRTELKGGWLYTGCPAKPVARVSSEELEAHHFKLRNVGHNSRIATDGGESRAEKTPGIFFLAPNAIVDGRVAAAENVGIWYGCILNAGSHRIDIGAGTNIQDNSTIHGDAGNVHIGSKVTIGHNATLLDCRIDDNSLVGIGSIISPGTIVEHDTLVAAGTETEVGQTLHAGFIWAGRPARPKAKIDEAKLRMMSDTVRIYIEYARHFRQTPHQVAFAREER